MIGHGAALGGGGRPPGQSSPVPFRCAAPFRSFPSPVTAMAGAAALGLSRELRTQPIRNRPRTSRWGQVEHGPVATSSTYVDPPRRAHSPRAASCRNPHYDPDPASGGQLLALDLGARGSPAGGSPTARHRPPDRAARVQVVRSGGALHLDPARPGREKSAPPRSVHDLDAVQAASDVAATGDGKCGRARRLPTK